MKKQRNRRREKIKKTENPIRRQRTRKLILSTFAVLILSFLFVLMCVSLYVTNNLKTQIDIKLFDNTGADTVSRLYYFDENGQSVEFYDERLYGAQVTVYKSLDDIPDDLENAFIAIEDKRYYDHSGVDWYRTFAAGANHILHFSSTFGASTITQQLIKNVTGSDEITVQRKLQEIFYALDLEEKMEKKEILEMYLNIVNLSQGCYGVGAASEKYFSKPVEELSLAECATLAAITKNPSYYDPIIYPQNNIDRRNIILYQMLEQGYISNDEYEKAKNEELIIYESRDSDSINSWYTDMVVEDVINDLIEELGYTRAAASYLVYNGGLKIYTSMDPEIQKTVTEYYVDESNFPSDDREQGRSAIVIIDPIDGDILGVAGNIGEKTGNRIQNYATDTLRPSGSSIKPLSVYAPALEEGIITWASVYDDIPLEFTDIGNGKYTMWPKNATNTYLGLSNIRKAIQDSLNTVSVDVLYDLGIDRSYEYLTEKFRIESLTETDKVPAALALGQETYGVTLLEMTAAYSVFANGGIYTAPRSYVMVMTRDGDVLLDNTVESERVISEGNAAVMTKLLETVVYQGSASKVTLKDTINVAGKTGTTQDTCDRWFIGYTPYYICGVWYGHEYPSSLPSSTKTVCSSTWNAIMTEIHSDIIESGNIKEFQVPNNVIKASFCYDSGKLMTAACLADPRGERIESGWFVDGTQPKSFCECHILVDYDTDGAGVEIEEDRESESIIKVGLIRVERLFPCQVYITDAQYVWRELSGDLKPDSRDGNAFFSRIFGSDEYCGISDTDRQYNSACREHYGYSPWD